MAKQTNIYRVAFHNPPQADGKTEFYFTSLAAIYDIFTDEQVGCELNALYAMRVSRGKAYRSELCIITRESLVSKEQTNPKRNKTTAEEQRTDPNPTEC